MGRLNLTGLLTWLALAVLVLVMMSFEDPFRMALAAVLLASMDPVRRLVLAFDRPIADRRPHGG
ncbi:hypothetical protein [Phenylobacterium sp. SCN 70-31]|uniref:hypothetical protein n=1 Tax=Phenylobacterium sp. SCN 70-31 TaxID=1660129 RepID=UPI0025FE2AE0|nr:hypothetical protein [Phenylobacterium sp. SCN 70-31]